MPNNQSDQAGSPPAGDVQTLIDMAEQQIDYMSNLIASEETQLEARLRRAPDSDKLRAAMRQDVDDRMAAVREQKNALERHVAQATGVVNVISSSTPRPVTTSRSP